MRYYIIITSHHSVTIFTTSHCSQNSNTENCERVSHTLWDCSAYTSIRAQFLLKLKASLGGSYARFEAMSSLDKSSFVLGNELWEEHFESLLALVKVYHRHMGGTKI